MSPSEEREGRTNPNRNILSAFLAVRPTSDSSCLLAVRRGSWAEETWLLRLLLSPIFHQGSTHTTSCTFNFPSQPWCRCFIPVPRPGLRVLRGGCRDGVLLMEAAAVGRERRESPNSSCSSSQPLAAPPAPGPRCPPGPSEFPFAPHPQCSLSGISPPLPSPAFCPLHHAKEPRRWRRPLSHRRLPCLGSRGGRWGRRAPAGRRVRIRRRKPPSPSPGQRLK